MVNDGKNTWLSSLCSIIGFSTPIFPHRQIEIYNFNNKITWPDKVNAKVAYHLSSTCLSLIQKDMCFPGFYLINYYFSFCMVFQNCLYISLQIKYRSREMTKLLLFSLIINCKTQITEYLNRSLFNQVWTLNNWTLFKSRAKDKVQLIVTLNGTRPH